MKKAFSILLALCLLLSLAGCGSAANDSAMPMAPSTPSTPTTSAPAEPEIGFDMNYGQSVSTEGALKTESTADGSQTVSSSLPQNVKLIYRGYLNLESVEFDVAASGLEQLVAQTGGYFESSELNNYSPYRNAYYVVRIPSAKYHDFCSQVGQLAQVNSQRHTTENVSEAYYDTESRLVTQRTKLERLQELLKKADLMEDIITLESAIAETELVIEQLTGTLRKYDALVDYATVEINLSEVYQLTEQEEPVIGFGAKLAEAFKTGTRRFSNDLESFALRFARNWVNRVIWLVILAVIAIVVIKILRKRLRPAKTVTPPPPQPEKPEEK